MTPDQARKSFREGTAAPTSGWAPGYAQANLIAVPRDWAYDFLLFAQRNRKPCPILDVTDPGTTSTALAPNADLRTDIPSYRVWENGELLCEVRDVTRMWRSDLVAFLLGCSFTFEHGLVAAGIPLRHVEQGRNVSMYITDRDCRPAGRIRGPLVVSMRHIPANMTEEASRISAMMPDVHGAPVHIGDPSELGIKDLSTPDFGDAVDAEAGDVPMYWACGVTPQAALMTSCPPFAITHSPGHMFITDVPDETYRIA
ncbi:putative hydro-lyase [Kibdelosporangium phytohabitans]|uniref:Putative hydro-lyase AOZ06_49075 n=1 Tax=Kibdelosporangium phytohabitans TaxID=860235 RepID=A0A0N9IG06_9PSEU|nr:putative hydro-lyase [Kibdelosporangium phytohabitans]ALG13769.1 hypothetical protein AOZ06_49075 [Kibdelosporangium phytohabitans]MBE1467316.1 uncharacterized protein YcsI (UPF0317 family) [Kibdelosporangium phytohabitans]